RPCRAADLDRGRRPLASGIGRLGTAWFARHWLSAGHLLRQPSECAGAEQDPAAGPRDNPRHRWRAHAASLSIAKLVFGAQKASRDQAGRARVGAFWKPGDPALISLSGPAWLGER